MERVTRLAGLTRGVNLSSGYRLLAMLFKFHGMVGADLLAIDHISSGTSPTSEGGCPVEVFFVNKAFSMKNGRSDDAGGNLAAVSELENMKASIEKSYSGDPTNWWIPNRACTEAMLRSAGFEIVAHPETEVFVCRWCDGPSNELSREIF